MNYFYYSFRLSLKPISEMSACSMTLVMASDFLLAKVHSARRQVSGHPEFWPPDEKKEMKLKFSIEFPREMVVNGL